MCWPSKERPGGGKRAVARYIYIAQRVLKANSLTYWPFHLYSASLIPTRQLPPEMSSREDQYLSLTALLEKRRRQVSSAAPTSDTDMKSSIRDAFTRLSDQFTELDSKWKSTNRPDLSEVTTHLRSIQQTNEELISTCDQLLTQGSGRTPNAEELFAETTAQFVATMIRNPSIAMSARSSPMRGICAAFPRPPEDDSLLGQSSNGVLTLLRPVFSGSVQLETQKDVELLYGFAVGLWKGLQGWGLSADGAEPEPQASSASTDAPPAGLSMIQQLAWRRWQSGASSVLNSPDQTDRDADSAPQLPPAYDEH